MHKNITAAPKTPATPLPSPQPKKGFDFHIGADPEFVLLAGEKFVPAKEVMQKFMEKIPELVSANHGYRVGTHGAIGWDGMDATGEFRPTPEKSPAALVSNLGALITVGVTTFPFLDFSPLSIVNPTGGHIHLEVPENMPKVTALRRAKTLCSLVAPLMAGENQVSAEYRRAKRASSYGSIDDIRINPHFTWPSGVEGYTAEIRFPTAEWLITPKIAEATLTLFSVVWDAVLTNELFRRAAQEVTFRNKKECEAITTLLSSKYANLGDSLASKIRRLIRTAPRYADFNREIDFALNKRLVLAEKEAANWLINIGWNITPKTTLPTKRHFLSQKAITTALGKTNERDYVDFVPVTTNSDLNLGVFEDALAERIAALRWRPNREYFLFGLKEHRATDTIIAFDNNGFYSGAEQGTYMEEVITTMKERAKKLIGFRSKIDLRTAKFRNPQNPVIVGIPFCLRATKQTKKFLSLILDIDNDRLTPTTFTFTAPAPRATPPTPDDVVSKSIPVTLSDDVISTISQRVCGVPPTMDENYEGMDLLNLEHWTRDGHYAVSRATRRDIPAGHIWAWYTGYEDSIIDLGTDQTRAASIIAMIAGIPCYNGSTNFTFQGNTEVFARARAVLSSYQEEALRI